MSSGGRDMKTIIPTGIFAEIMVVTVITGCGGGGSSSSTSSRPNDPTNQPPSVVLAPANASSPYANVLVDCALAQTDRESCTLTKLPLLGQEKTNPAVDDLLDRTVVSHAWMGVRFRQVLQTMPDDIFTLMKGVTSVVIAWDTRPSYYYWRTGAIFIDPAHLWLTNSEKSTISTDPDYRTDFGSELSFVSLYRYVMGTQYAWEYFDLEGDETRTLSDIELGFAAMLYHELAHANDAFPPSELAHLDRSMSLVEAFASLDGSGISQQLAARQPLNSQLWMDLAEVLYLGATATVAQRQLTATQVGLEFEGDGASDDYAYTDSWEDFAMLVEEIMMRHHHGVDREIAYTNMPAGDDARYCDFYVVHWGVRNRIAEPLVRSRAEFGLQLLLDQADVSAYFQGLPSQWHMATGRDWCDIQYRNPSAAKPLAAASTPASRTPIRRGDLAIPYR